MKKEVERVNLLSIFDFALQSVRGRSAVSRYLTEQKIKSGPIAILAIGKAAFSMLEGAVDILGPGISRSLLITKDGHLGDISAIPNLETQLAAHPVPDERSLHAGNRLVDWLSALPLDLPLLVLISGGASSLVEKLPEGLSLSDIQRLNQWLLSSGLRIEEMNTIRRSISLIKGGRLLGVMGDRKITQLLISDVPGDDPAIIGSGLLVKGREAPVTIGLPEWLIDMQQLADKSIKHYSQVRQNIQTAIVASNKIACEAARQKASECGYPSKIMATNLDGDVHDCAESISNYLNTAEAGCYIWGGETTVQLPAAPGRGGRNQQLALLLAEKIQGQSDIRILCAGTDGTDGPTEDAGALIDGETVKRGQLEGLDVHHALASADAGSFLAASGDLINTGPTGTNVMDLVMALKA